MRLNFSSKECEYFPDEEKDVCEKEGVRILKEYYDSPVSIIELKKGVENGKGVE